MSYSSVLAKEAVVVGAANVAFVLAIRRVLPVSPRWELLQIALAGAFFHLTAEASGMNAWYLKNGAAAMKAEATAAIKNSQALIEWNPIPSPSSCLESLGCFGQEELFT